MSSDPIIELKNVWKKYKIKKQTSRTLREDIVKIFSKKFNKELLVQGEFWSLSDINISINNGESVGLYGPNGSGKTTILKLLSRVTYPTRGELTVRGSIAPLISVGAGFHPELTGRENIYTNGTMLGMSIKDLKEKESAIIEFSGLDKKFLELQVKNYSSGMNTRLGFSVAVHSDADIFLLDEILAVGDTKFREKCAEKINDLIGQRNKTFLIVSHQHERLKELTDRIYYIEKGKITDLV